MGIFILDLIVNYLRQSREKIDRKKLMSVFYLCSFLVSSFSIRAEDVNPDSVKTPASKESTSPGEKKESKKSDIGTDSVGDFTQDPTREEDRTFNPHWFTSQLGEGFTITSDDGQSLINLRIRAQLRATQQVVPEDRTEDSTTFSARRLRLMARGKMKGDDWHYYVQFGFANQDMERDRPIPLRDAILTYNGWKDIKFSFGQMKVPFNRQRLNSSSALQMVDRSIVNGELNLDRDVGIQMFTHNLFGFYDKIGVNVGVFGGDGRNRTASGNGVLTIGKITYYPFGNFLNNRLAGVDDELLSEGDFRRYTTPKLAISIGGGVNQNTNRDLSTLGNVYQFARFDYTHQLAELMLKWYGWTFSTELISRKANLPYIERENSGILEREYSRSAYGGFVQVAYLFESNWEIALRWGEYKPWEETDPRLLYSREAGGGVSYYFSKHNLKWQIDYFKLDGNPLFVAGTHEFRTQLQFFY
jgi:hypothetical protein